MARGNLTFDFPAVLRFVQTRMPMPLSEDMRGIGLERDGDVIAGVLYEGFNGPNIWMHVAAIEGGSWLNRRFLRAVFRYPFEVCGCQQVWGWVEACNAQARRFDEHLGFREQARLPGAASDGGDLIVYVMRRQDCRYLGGSDGK